IGSRLATTLGWPFYDADDFHPPENKRKMNSGQPLDDVDRRGWLERLRDLIHENLSAGRPLVLACSALKNAYRDVLARDAAGVPSPEVVFVYLKAAPEVVQHRIYGSTGHFITPALLDSPYATLEAPTDALVVDGARPPNVIVEEIRRRVAHGA